MAPVLMAVAMTAGCLGNDDVSFPSPDDLDAAPFAEGSRAGGWEATFASVTTEDRADTVCRSYVRFTADGSLAYAGVACDEPDAELDWLDPDGSEVDRGDYAVSGDVVSLRVVMHDVVTESFSLRELRGERFGDRLVLQVPAVAGYLGVPSPPTEPVTRWQLKLWPPTFSTRSSSSTRPRRTETSSSANRPCLGESNAWRTSRRCPGTSCSPSRPVPFSALIRLILEPVIITR